MPLDKKSLIGRVNKAISLLSSHNDEAIQLLHPFIPVNGPVAVDYGIYTLQYALLFLDVVKNKKANSDNSMPIKIASLFEDCKNKNIEEYKKFIEWLCSKMQETHEQMKRARVNLLIDSALQEALSTLNNINPDTVRELVLKIQQNPTPHLLANSYKDMFEVEHFINILANLIKIGKGSSFSDSPFGHEKLNGKRILDKNGFMKKGLAIEWLKLHGDSFMVKIIETAYNAQLRNLLGGHNSYHFNNPHSTYEDPKNRSNSYKYEDVFTYLSNLELLFSALRLEGLTRNYEDLPQPGHISEIGFMDWRFNEKADHLLVLQNWSNFAQRKVKQKPKRISFYRDPFQRPGKFISLGFDDRYIVPYDLRVIAGPKSSEFMTELAKRKMLKVTIAGIAPNVEPFNFMSKSEIELEGESFLVINDLTITVEINREALQSLIEYLVS